MKNSLQNQVYQQIKQDILLCRLKPGDHLFDKELAEKLQISRTPVREALLLLEKDRLLVSEKRFGFVVRRISLAEIRQFFEIRGHLLDYAAELLVNNARAEDIDRLQEIAGISEQCHAKGRRDDYVLACADFHKVLREATHCEIYIRVMEDLNDIMTMFRAMTVNIPNSVDRSIKEHRDIIAALRRRELCVIKKALLRHLEGSRANMQILAGEL